MDAVARPGREDPKRLPEGAVTFLFSDVEGSTKLLERHGSAMGAALARHLALVEAAVKHCGGVVFETVGDAVYAAFDDPAGAASAALRAHRSLAAEDWGDVGGRLAVRIAIHTGPVERRGDHYFGPALFRSARIQALAHGEQTLLSGVTSELLRDELPDGARLEPLGEHRLKDLEHPEPLYQLEHPDLRREFPALRSLDAHPNNLPSSLASFIGRQGDLDAIGALIDGHRLVTLTGPGGIGKTRLALQVAAQRTDDHADGVWFVELAQATDSAAMLSTIARVLGLRDAAGQPLDAAIAEHLLDRCVLLVLDNMEQLTDAAAVVARLLSATGSTVSLLATSRVPLHVAGEREYPVGPVATEDGARLFAERALDADVDSPDGPHGPAIRRLCQRLDGLPLAIELAAARSRLLAPGEMLDRLGDRLDLLEGPAGDRPARHVTMRAAIAWSEELLPASARSLFGRLAVMSGTFDLAAAKAVAADPATVLRDLEAVLEANLLHSVRHDGQTRYGMLETIGAYALERLRAIGDEADARGRHAQHFLAVVEELVPLSLKSEGVMSARRLPLELDNVSSACEWAIGAEEADLAVRLLAGVWSFWDAFLFQHTDGLGWAERILRMDGLSEAQRAEATHVAGIFANVTGNAERARQLWTEALEMRRRVGDVQGEARALNNLAIVEPDLAEAAGLLHQALALPLTEEQQQWIRYNLAALLQQADDLTGAVALYERCIVDGKRLGDYQRIAASERELGDIALSAGRIEEALTRAEASRRLAAEREHGPMELLAIGLKARGHARAGAADEGRVNLAEGLGRHRLAWSDDEDIADEVLLSGAEVAAACGEPSLARAVDAARDALPPSVRRFPHRERSHALLLKRHDVPTSVEKPSSPADGWERLMGWLGT